MEKMLTPESALLEYLAEDEDPDWLVVEPGDWVDEGKWSHKTTVYKYPNTERYFAVTDSRSGSYFTDFEYEDPELYEVVPVEVTRTEYKVKK